MGILFVAPGALGSSVLFDSGDPGFGDGFVSDPQYPGEYGNDFTLTAGADVTGFSWYGAYKPPGVSPASIGPDDFSIRIFGIASGVPNAIPLVSFSGLATSRIDTGGTLYPGGEMYAYSTTVAATFLGPGTYLLSMLNDTIPGDDLWVWAWSNQSFQPGKALYSRSQDGDSGPFTTHTTQVSFKVLGDTAVPEPSPSALVATGILALVCARHLLFRKRLMCLRNLITGQPSAGV